MEIDRTTVWVAQTTALQDQERFAAYYARMPRARQQKINACRLPKDQRLSLGAGILLQRALAAYGIADDGAYGYGPYKKPYLLHYPQIQFNLSHSEQAVMCIVSPFAVGCDIEYIQPGVEQVADRFFSETERQEMHALTSPREKTAHFFRLWTLKESYIKAIGAGLAQPLKSFSVIWQDGQPRLASGGENCRFYEFTPFADYACACCICGGEETVPPGWQPVDFGQSPV